MARAPVVYQQDQDSGGNNVSSFSVSLTTASDGQLGRAIVAAVCCYSTGSETDIVSGVTVGGAAATLLTKRAVGVAEVHLYGYDLGALTGARNGVASFGGLSTVYGRMVMYELYDVDVASMLGAFGANNANAASSTVTLSSPVDSANSAFIEAALVNGGANVVTVTNASPFGVAPEMNTSGPAGQRFRAWASSCYGPGGASVVSALTLSLSKNFAHVVTEILGRNLATTKHRRTLVGAGV